MSDPRIGQVDSDGAILRHPTLDAFGKTFQPPYPVTCGIGSGYFVVLPSNTQLPDNLRAELVKAAGAASRSPVAKKSSDE